MQVEVLPITDRHLGYSRQLAEKLRAVGVRVEVDDRNEKVGYKIREAQMAKIPYMLIIGDRELKEGTVSVRARSEGDMGAMSFSCFQERIRTEIAEKAFN